MFVRARLLPILVAVFVVSGAVEARAQACSPVSATISAPFSFDGAGTLCWKSSNLGGYINSWNTASVTINGVNISNVYVACSSYPAKASDGFWYISYSSSVAWGHFETSGTPCSGGATATATAARATSTATSAATATATIARATATATATASTSGLANGAYKIVNKNSGKCVDDNAGGTANGTSVQQWTCTGGTNQVWQLTATDSGYYKIATQNNTAQGWDITGGTTATGDGVKLQLYQYGGGTNQQFQPVSEGGGYYHLVARHDGKCIDVNGSSTADGVQLQQWTCNGGSNESFQITTTSAATPTAIARVTATPTPTTARATATATSGGSVGKFVGNITTGGQIRSDFLQYWNQITPENEGKWGSVETSPGVYNWSAVDRIYNFAQQNNIPFKEHTFVWGAQYPSFINNMTSAQKATEIENWIHAFCTRYPNTKYIDVVNEATPGHNPATYAQDAFGSNWIIRSFQLARQYCPNATLILNDYNVSRWNTDQFIAMAQPVVAAGVVDAIGDQAHGYETESLSELQTNFNKIAALGKPIYITEYDIALTDDQQQLQVMQQQFPFFYTHPSVKGMTLWGYVVGQTWVNGSGLIQSDGTKRPAMTWLMNYLGR